MSTFWMVYGLHQKVPTARHKTEKSAVDEASRLARNNPGVQFFVLQATHNIVKRDVDIVTLSPDPYRSGPWDSGDDGIPF